ncbi:hypothetical protein [Streptomyces sp. NPDC090083]|uniref:hypothetical protein n=1 Tax=Streptomyces sp. NPDC090083 TaxID=3365941 RepID=UPI0037FD71F4
MMKPALVEASLIAANDGKTWGWEASREMMHHRCWQTYAGVQLGAGEDPVSVSHWMGHASVVITLQIYVHFMTENGERGRTAVGSWLESGRLKAVKAVDLRGVEVLDFSTAAELVLPASDVTGPREVVVVGARYGGTWAVGVRLETEGALVGEIRTGAGTDPDRVRGRSLLAPDDGGSQPPTETPSELPEPYEGRHRSWMTALATVSSVSSSLPLLTGHARYGRPWTI